MTRLRRCRTVWGETALTQGLPPRVAVRDALYLPCRHDGPWGLFSDGRPLGGTGHGLPEAGIEAHGDALPAAIGTAPEAAYLYIGPLILHYGHFITDTLSRLWPVRDWRGPRPRLLCHPLTEQGLASGHGFLRDMLAGLGLSTADLVAFDRPMRIPRAIVPDPSFLTQARAHAVFGKLCRSIGRRHWHDGEVDRITRPAYLAKTRVRGAIGQLVNEERVAAELDRRGVEIVYPETLGFGEQVRLFATRRMILGTAGSAFHTSVFSAPGRRLVGLNWAEHLNANFALFDALAGNRAYYYSVNGTTYETVGAVGVRWTIPEPERIAVDLLERAEAFDRLDARDAADEASRARRARSLGGRLRRWRRGLTEGPPRRS